MGEKLSMDQLGRITAADFKKAAKVPIVVVLDQIRSGLNVGSIFRSADAFRIERIICCGYTPVPPHREVLKSALGATESVEWNYEENTIKAVQQLRSEGVHVYAVEQTSDSVQMDTFRPQTSQRLAIVLGNEVNGVSQEVIAACNGCFEIAQFGTKHSLNVAVCAGIVLYDLTVKLRTTVH
jgi:23S rRNA (guanosine2251-2'-O)-methyltransferase